MADHTEVILEPGNFFSIPPGHDSWVLGDEQYVSLHLLAAEDYAAPQASGDEPPAAVSAPIGKHNAPLFTWGDGCEGWTLLSTP
ncbi:MAG TPA: hypothetical protein VFA70_08595, partial [Dehalococcoidia bacterium]|nr:hypothetical protein [Dehalococcoidia bacterium]